MKAKKILVAGFVAGIVILLISFIVDAIVQQVWPVNYMELGGMRAADDPIMMLFFLNYWVIGFAMAIVYPYFSDKIKGNYICKGKKFGFLIWLVASLPSVFIVYTSMNYPIGFTISQFVGSLFYMLCAGITTAKLMK